MEKQIKNQESIKLKSIELAKSNQTLKDFVSIASHDLQAPIRKIISFSSRIKEKNLEYTQESKEYLERIQKVAKRMEQLLDDLLIFSQVSSHSESFHIVDLNTILSEVLEDLNISRLKENIKIGSLPRVEAHIPQMRQLFQNLISNSIKFHKEGITPKVEIQGKQTNTGHWKIYIKDQGIGFDEKYRDLIFRPFERLHGVDEFEGTGMGLAICKKIVERHGGEITARSQPDQGACFIFTLQEKNS